MRNFYNELDDFRREIIKEIKERLDTLPLVDNLRKFELTHVIVHQDDLDYICMRGDWDIFLTPKDTSIEYDLDTIYVEDCIHILDMLRDIEE